MKKRDIYWVNKIMGFLFITLVFCAVSIINILQFNYSYIQEEREELQLFKKQIEWVVQPLLAQENLQKLQEYCNDFQDEDIAFRIFDKNENLVAASDLYNKSQLVQSDNDVFRKKYNILELYKHSTKDKKIKIIETIYVNKEVYYLELTVSQADVMKSILSAQKTSLVFFSISIFVFIILLIQIFYTLRNTFNELEDSVIKLANGDLDAEIKIPKLDLLNELTISIKKMTKRLKTQIAQLTQLEQYKSEFLQNITHEIKTPITAINSAIELVQTDNSLSAEDNECLDIIMFQTKSIDKLVNDILYLSETEAEKVNERQNFKRFNLNETIRRTISYTNYSGIEIKFIERAEVELFGHEDLISTAISNLVTNAIKYSNSDKIEIEVLKADSDIEIFVKDSGVGIAEEHLGLIFEKFYRIDKARSRQLGGTGLGLSIVKNIVELHNGNITVESEIGKGTSFKISLRDEV